MSSLIIVQARMCSTRMPGKVLLPFIEKANLIDIQFTRLKELNKPVVLAASDNPADDLLEKWAEENGVDCFRGDEYNVLERFIACAKYFEASNLIRVCSDNPFLIFAEVNPFLEALEKGNDYVSYCDLENIPAIRKHWGLFVEGVRLEALEKVQAFTRNSPKKEFFQEHVTNYIYGQPKRFKVLLKPAPEVIIGRDDLRFTIDTHEDFENMNALFRLLPEGHSLEQLIRVADSNDNVKKVMMDNIKAFNK